jgi:5'-nucleotidase
MLRYFLLNLFILLSIVSSSQDGKKITFLFTNDLHSRLTGYAPESDYTPLVTANDKTKGGFARIAAVFNDVRKKNNGILFTVDAGDFLMGTLFQSLEPETGFELQLMQKMGYDAVATGNHEFDYGPEKLADIVASASKEKIPAILLSNAVFSPDNTEDDRLAKLFDENIITRKFVIEREGIKAGFFSLLGKSADENAAFATPVTFGSQIATAKKMVKELQAENCDIIVCLSHSGVSKEKNGKWGGEDVGLASKVKGIDVIISGHTHTMLEEPIIVKGIPVVQSGEYGQYVGKLTVRLDKGKTVVEDYELIPIDDRIAGDPEINKYIESQKDEISRKILEPMGMDYESPVAESAFMLECNEQGDFINSNLGPFVADAIYRYVNNHVATGTDISMVAVGVIRDKIVPGIQTAPDIFRVMSMGSGKDNVPGYPLARLYVTGKELKSILEILQVAYKSAAENYCFYSGISIDYNPSKGLLKKIRKIDIVMPDGKVRAVDFSRKNKTLYSVTANFYMLEFIGIIKKMSFGLINVVPKDINGKAVTDMKTAILDLDEKKTGLQEGKEWLAIMEFIKSMKDTNGNGIPDIDINYTRPVLIFHETKE